MTITGSSRLLPHLSYAGSRKVENGSGLGVQTAPVDMG